MTRSPNFNCHSTMEEILARARLAGEKGLITEAQLADLRTGADNLRPTADHFTCAVIAEALLCWLPSEARSFILDDELSAAHTPS